MSRADNRAAPLVVTAAAELYASLHALVRQQRLIFVAGLPGTGKSLLVHQLAHLAAAAGRGVHLLPWDVVRPVFEACPAGKRYPVVNGVTHARIRLAVGRWARAALVQWHRDHPGPAPLLIGETPLIGHRFIELARPAEDAAEALLTAKTCCFVVPVPSPPVRRHIEAERRRRSARPRNAQEREDAPPQVLEALWHELWQAAVALGLTAAAPAGYDPELYQRVYCHVLRHRRVVVLPITQILPTAAFSVYDYTVPVSFLRPTPQTAAAWIAQVERQYAEDTPLAQVVASWYQL